ncbi:hypothetical protein KKG58_05825 [Patescibacteria group bacterium]|nr:hypothetical protein [Patescibacteria group bacterium]
MKSEQNFNIESGKEKENFDSKIFLSFFRHGEKPSKMAEGAGVGIIPESRKECIKNAPDFGPENRKDIEQSIGFGASSLRTLETAGFIMGGIKDEITGEENLEELKKKLDKEINIGTKLSNEKLLSFAFSKDSEVDQSLIQAAKKGDWLKFIVEKSDNMAQELKDKKAITYTRISAQVAKLILKYVNVEKKWDELVKDKEKEYNPTLERYFSAPAAITAFLAKIIEKVKGEEERSKFEEFLKEGYFGYLDGFSVEIINPTNGDCNSPHIIVKYHKEDKETGNTYNFQEEINKDLLEELIDNGIKFEESINKG